MKSVELFAGAGGLAIGVAKAGFEHQVVIESDKNAVATLKANKSRSVEHVRDWNIFPGLAEKFDYRSVGPGITLISGGPPCQPFSLGGKHGGRNDKRDMFPHACATVRILRPEAFLFENVKGLLRKNFKPYFEYILRKLGYPNIEIKPKETWREHFQRLEKHHARDKKPSADWYRIKFRLLNAANFGVPQKRERVFIVGIRADLEKEFEFPVETHSEDSLIISKWITSEYWDEFGISPKKRPGPTIKERRRINVLTKNGHQSDNVKKPWETVRRALKGLTSLKAGQRCFKDPNHYLNPGARSYPGHTGSSWDEPSKTLKAGDHGVPGGENTVRINGDGDVRYYSVREAARIQTFPDDYVFEGAWSVCMRQLGNAVPVELANVVAGKLAASLKS